MILRNIPRIVSDNYESLVHEAWGRGNASRLYVGLVFALIPSVIGVVLGYISPVESGLAGVLVSMVGVLTGFSINAIVLLSNHSAEDTFQQEIDAINKTRDFTLYSILVGIVLLMVLVLGLIIANSGPLPDSLSANLSLPISGTQILSSLIYILVVHYFVVLLVIAHRLYSLVNTPVLGEQ